MKKIIKRSSITLNNIFLISVVLWLALHWGLTTPDQIITWGQRVVITITTIEVVGVIREGISGFVDIPDLF